MGCAGGFTLTSFRLNGRPGIGDLRIFLMGMSVLGAYLAGQWNSSFLLIAALLGVYVCGVLKIEYRGKVIWGPGDTSTGWQWGKDA